MPRALICPQCGGALPPRSLRAVVACPYCRASVSLDGALVRAADFRTSRDALVRAYGDRGRMLTVAGVPYRVMQHVATGESTDVFLAERAHPVSERVLLHVLRDAADAPLLRHAADVLRNLSRSDAQGAAHFTRRLPQCVALGMSDDGGASRLTLVVRHHSGFVDTLRDVRDAFPDGIDARHATWIWRRMLETLGFVHRTGQVHGCVLPQHVVVHAGDHGAMLVGWSASVRVGEPLEIACEADLDWYPRAMLDGAPLSALDDLVMTARAIAWLLRGGTDFAPPASAPRPIVRLLERYLERDVAEHASSDAWELSSRVSTAAAEAFGPPRFVQLSLPSWELIQKGSG